MGILQTLSGMEVAVDRPVKAGAVAHRPRYTDQPGVVGPACHPVSVKEIPAARCAEFSAGWAHEIGAVPCPRGECFGGQA